MYMYKAMGPSALTRTTRILAHGDKVGEGQNVRLHAQAHGIAPVCQRAMG